TCTATFCQTSGACSAASSGRSFERKQSNEKVIPCWFPRTRRSELAWFGLGVDKPKASRRQERFQTQGGGCSGQQRFQGQSSGRHDQGTAARCHPRKGKHPRTGAAVFPGWQSPRGGRSLGR